MADIRIYRKIGTAHMCHAPSDEIQGREWAWDVTHRRPEALVPEGFARSLAAAQPDMYALVDDAPAVAPVGRSRKAARP